MYVNPHPLTWAEVDPARHPFDPDGAAAVVRARSGPVPPQPVWDGGTRVGFDEAHRWRDALTGALVEHYGQWASGWCYSTGEGDYDGGPVGNWCCVSHSITTPEATLDLVVASLLEWRSWLESLSERFAGFLPMAADDAGAWEVAVAHLVTATVGRTGSDSAWYGHCQQVLGWFLTAAGVPERRHARLLADAVGGRFRSWVAPSPADVVDIAERLAADVSGAVPVAAVDWPDTWPQDWPSRRTSNLPAAARDPVTASLDRPGARRFRGDDLGAWLAVRDRVDWDGAGVGVTGPVRGARDGIAEHYAGDAAMTAALARVRAATGPLTFGLLADWQRTVLGVPSAGFRLGPAFAKGGREHYVWHPGLPARFDECLAEAADPDVPLASRATRAYLDVAFFHPFDDGNARSAALALYHVLALGGVVLDRAAPLLMTVRRAGDERGAEGLARFVAVLIEATRTRHPHRP